MFRIFEHGVVGLDKQGRVLLANQAGSRLFERKEPRFIGEPLPTLVGPRDRAAVQRVLKESTKAPLPKNRHVEVSARASPVRLRIANLVEDGVCAGLLTIVEGKAPKAKAEAGATSA